MSYLVLARKYRPQTFAEVIGQEHVTRTLQNAITRGRIHHAFLFCGGRGTGKTTTARILAKALSCEQAPTPNPCNQCDACVEITRGTSVDVQEIDAASQNKVEDIRELRESIRYAPVRGKKKLFILDEVHMLSTSAFNALLKTLEEPPPHAVFVFATTDPHKLPATILSRVQRYDFKLVPTARLVEHLEDVLGREKIEFERSALQLVAREGAGSVRDSLSLLDQVLASVEGTLTEEQVAAILGVADWGLILDLGRALVNRDPAQALQIVDSAYSRGYDLAQLARTLLGHLRDLVVVRVVKEPLGLIEATSSELEELQRQAKQAGAAAELLFDRMVRIADETARSPLQRYVLEVGLVELCQVGPLQPFEELVGRLESLQGLLEQGDGGPPAPGQGKGGGGPGPGRGPGNGHKPSSPPAAAGSSAAPVSPPPPVPPRSPSLREGAESSRGLTPSPAGAVERGDARPFREPPPERPPARPAPESGDPLPQPQTQAAPPARSQPVDAPAPSDLPQPQPQAAPPAPPPQGPAPAPEGQRGPVTWDQLAQAILRKDPLMHGIAVSRPLHWDQHRLVLGFDNQFFVEQMQDKLAPLRRIVASELGHEVQIEVRFVADMPPSAEQRAESLVETEQRKGQEERASRRREAMGHPSRKLLTEVFGDGISFQEPELE